MAGDGAQIAAHAQTWRNVSDGFFKRASVGALAVSKSDPNVIYVGMGETTIEIAVATLSVNMIPNIGAVITNVIGILIALVFGEPAWLDALAVFGTLMWQSILESTILYPNIMSHQVGLHPVLIIIALFVFGAFLGLLGLLIAVPATALIMAAYKAYKDSVHIELGTLDHIGKEKKPTVPEDVEHALEGEPLESEETEAKIERQEQEVQRVEEQRREEQQKREDEG